jgi:nucleoside-diphosphate-sugar epimerase
VSRPAERFLVTGALGCVGAWTVGALVRDSVPVVAFDLGQDRSRLELVMRPEELEQVALVRGDVTDAAELGRVLDEHEITHVLHLAALLIPLAKADPRRGAAVNVGGTVNVLQAAAERKGRIEGVVYASSIAAYDAADAVPGGVVAEESVGRPVTQYGVHKQANEGLARVFWLDERVPSVGLRPYVVYGPGRDTGLTASPTLAMEAVARGEPYRISYGGRSVFQYAPDAAAAFIGAARNAHEGAPVFNLPGAVAHMREVVAAIQDAAPEAEVDFEDVTLPFPVELETVGLGRLLGTEPVTPLAEGVAATIEHFRRGGA